MQIRMKETHRISEDAHTVRRLEEGKTYEVAETAARFANRNGWAEEVGVSDVAA